MRPPWRCWLLFLAAGLLGGPAQADGGFFGPKGQSLAGAEARAELSEPSQKALLVHDGAKETLILQVKYRGGASSFGWVVPVPTRPKVSTVSSKLFYDLALVTRPRPARGRAAGSASLGAMQSVPAPQVRVIEEVQVGPYQATILAANDASALAQWLDDHGYAAPPRLRDVLQPYVDRRWYYVAAQIRPALTKPEDLLRQLDPKAADPNEAPEHVAAELVRLGMTDWRAGERRATEVQRAIDQLAPGHEAAVDLGGNDASATVKSLYTDYLIANGSLHRGLVGEGKLRTCLTRCQPGVGSPEFGVMARAAGLSQPQSKEGLVADIGRAIQRDLVAGVPYEQSRFGRFQAALAASDRLSVRRPGKLARMYGAVQQALAMARAFPLSAGDDRRIMALLHARWVEGDEPINGDAIFSLIASRDALYRGARKAVEAALGGASRALAGGTITPLRLDFDSKTPVYPLRISSLNPGSSDIQVYVLSDHRAEAKGFRTEFANRLGGDTPAQGAVARFAKPGHDYLTELRAQMQPEDMRQDLVISRHWTDWPYRPRPAGEVPLMARREWGLLLLAGAGIGGLWYARRRRRARASASPSSPCEPIGSSDASAHHPPR